ncbi:hypothetical protein H4Q26_016186 [Puccinia striiformis f. sp. tritici PST-130]|nr:hypothetical protein H4Q26_016186 [Puccinia striiformis f. sp. tritici PST-130]
MLRYFRPIALVLLMASWEVAGDRLDGTSGDTPFGCHKNVDAVCADRLRGGQFQILTWTERVHPKKRDYLCHHGTKPQCCDHGKYQDIDNAVKLAANEKLRVKSKIFAPLPKETPALVDVRSQPSWFANEGPNATGPHCASVSSLNAGQVFTFFHMPVDLSSQTPDLFRVVAACNHNRRLQALQIRTPGFDDRMSRASSNRAQMIIR